MVKFASAVVISFWCLIATAADWQVVADTEVGQLRLDKSTVAKEGQYTFAVLVYQFTDSQKIATPPYALFNLRMDDVLVDCAALKLGVQARRFYKDDNLVSTFTLKFEEVKFNPPAPNTMAETVVKAVCAVVPKTKL